MTRRVALIGAGLAARPHLQALQALHCDVPVVVTRSRERLAAVRTYFPHAQPYGDTEAALAERVDAALVLTPPNSHLEAVAAAGRAGIPVVVEKPLGISLPQAQQLVAVAEQAGIGLAVCFQHRAKPAAQALRQALANGDLGDVFSTAVTVPWWRDPEYYRQPGRGSYRRDGGGVLITQAIHVLDLLVWLIGAPRRVAAVAGHSPTHTAEAETTISLLLDYGDGRGVTFFASVAARPGTDEQLVLLATTATARLEGARLRITRGDRGPVTVGGDANTAGVADPAALPSAWHRALLADAFAAFDHGHQPLAAGASALRTQRVIAACYRAAHTGEWTSLDDPALEEDCP